MANEKYLCLLTPEQDTVILNLNKLFSDYDSTKQYEISFTTNDEYIKKHVYFDSMSLKDWNGKIQLNDSLGIHIIRLDVSDNKIKQCSFGIKIGTFDEIMVQISDSDLYTSEDVSSESKIISGPLESFMLLRTNPKLTGNIKLVVDSDYDLYLDTFKVSNVLNDRIYRKHPISAEGNYARDVMQVFSKLP